MEALPNYRNAYVTCVTSNNIRVKQSTTISCLSSLLREHLTSQCTAQAGENVTVDILKNCSGFAVLQHAREPLSRGKIANDRSSIAHAKSNDRFAICYFLFADSPPRFVGRFPAKLNLGPVPAAQFVAPMLALPVIKLRHTRKQR